MDERLAMNCAKCQGSYLTPKCLYDHIAKVHGGEGAMRLSCGECAYSGIDFSDALTHCLYENHQLGKFRLSYPLLTVQVFDESVSQDYNSRESGTGNEDDESELGHDNEEAKTTDDGQIERLDEVHATLPMNTPAESTTSEPPLKKSKVDGEPDPELPEKVSEESGTAPEKPNEATAQSPIEEQTDLAKDQDNEIITGLEMPKSTVEPAVSDSCRVCCQYLKGSSMRSLESNRRSHVISCSGIRAFECSRCKADYTRKEVVKNHLSKQNTTCFKAGVPALVNKEENEVRFKEAYQNCFGQKLVSWGGFKL